MGTLVEKYQLFFIALFLKYKLFIVLYWFIAKIISISQNIHLEAIQNGAKSNSLLSDQIFARCELQTMWNLQTN